MIQGTGSDVGKSLLVAALCRIYRNRGLSVAPFKAQNMALNSFVTPDGLEIGRAQALQAAAARLEPAVEMNPVLIKPHGYMKSQIVVMGRPWKDLEAADYYRTKERLWSHVRESLDSLTSRYDLVICEGAGSPAEINLKESEIVNMAVARYLEAPVLLAADIDRGGVFASLYGTVELMDEDEKALIKGFLINKFRGDVALLEPGLKMLEDLTGGRKTLGVIPWMPDPGLAQEDSVFVEKNRHFGGGPVDIVIIGLPRMSNYDDFDALLLEDGIGIRIIDRPRDIGNPSAVIIPGSKTTAADLAWMRETGIEREILALAEKGTAVAGICGGYQMLGDSISDPLGLEGDKDHISGMGLLPAETVLTPDKKTVRAQGRPASGRAFLRNLSEAVSGYEIHMGVTELKKGALPLFICDTGEKDGAISENGKIWGTYFHGVFNEPGFRRKWLESIGWTPSGEPRSLNDVQEEHLDRLARIVEENCSMDLIDGIIGL
ncbi:MAG: cobyric acid synthase [Spirochaetales bacterium]|nr:cobyric acid synthase [Spirochaetales bacterium]